MISVILLTYNSLSVLPDCIHSLERCTSAEQLEVIIADNGSADGTPRWLEAYSAAGDAPFQAVKVLHLQTNRGYAFGNNRALELASGDIVLLLNPDTLVGEDAIATCASRLQSDSRIGAVGCRLELPDGTSDRACKRTFPTLWNSVTRFSGLSMLFPKSRWLAGYNLTYLDERGSYPVDCLCGAFLMVSRKVYQTVGALDEDYFMYGEDIDWCYRIKRAGYHVWYEGFVTTVHLKGGNGGKRSRQSLRYFYDTMYLYYTKTRHHSAKSVTAWLLRVALTLMYHVHVQVKRVGP